VFAGGKPPQENYDNYIEAKMMLLIIKLVHPFTPDFVISILT
jgi:hypothetical protein